MDCLCLYEYFDLLQTSFVTGELMLIYLRMIERKREISSKGMLLSNPLQVEISHGKELHENV